MQPSPESDTEPLSERKTRTFPKRGITGVDNVNSNELSQRLCSSCPSRAGHESLSTLSKSVPNGGDYDVQWHGFRDSNTRGGSEGGKDFRDHLNKRDRLSSTRINSPIFLSSGRTSVKHRAEESDSPSKRNEDAVWLLNRRNDRQHLRLMSQEAVYLVIDKDAVPVNARDLVLRWSWVFRGPHFSPLGTENRPLIQGWIWKLKRKTDSIACSLALATRASRIPYVGRHLVANKRFITIDIENRVFYYRKGNRSYSMPFYFDDIVSVDISELTWAKEFGFCGIHIRHDTPERSVCFCVQTKAAFHTWLYAFLLACNTQIALPYPPMLPHEAGDVRVSGQNIFGECLSQRPSTSFACALLLQTSSSDRQSKGRKRGICQVFVKFWRLTISPIFVKKSRGKKRTQDTEGSEEFVAEHCNEVNQISCTEDKLYVNELHSLRPPVPTVTDEAPPGPLSMKSMTFVCALSSYCRPTGFEHVRSPKLLDREQFGNENSGKLARCLSDSFPRKGSHLWPYFLDASARDQQRLPLQSCCSPPSRQKRNEVVLLTEPPAQFSGESLSRYDDETHLDEGITERQSVGINDRSDTCLSHELIQDSARSPRRPCADVSGNQNASASSAETNEGSCTEPTVDSFVFGERFKSITVPLRANSKERSGDTDDSYVSVTPAESDESWVTSLEH
ncbi:hypothetical protein TGPRC2_233950 [Toxoplasma gondii TgCatPRC2]|uniref:PH domain-containing protein n=4 Tax=Toxoplasma gondii TaxID=5811 RepID=B6KK69_TOXGV|nr:hypothetical protein TGME49_233950 [Toxoplasma gondii ME49]ESS36072.1 hypothetical protein TGVEG_233950 [Toxoplasma gondii VEG]KYF46387.1 hypothetical protein TGARI_233950 [Toxoplasma gondii ARI]KYK71441.1 hypothetical protein TGPRC2_233950 [Toxoplasma gondii TgCatPRC2]EPT28728.1 hypothetical protein TGME49_233950 [Toxoplasma gondii ME49]CEL75040.1 TPA: hypothetical protein BN1205_021570 [Toxoplasma gondii VEG]|eukprot:XP_002368242.1 hypothetical protein TGME49_233950 [Toxoplasma gondii ME49]